ncbi:MAG: leucyl aminopeptidase [Chlamydiota bacterium]
MDFSSAPNLEKRKNADVLIIPFWEGKAHAERAIDLGRLKSTVYMPIDTGDFKGKKSETSLIYLTGQKEKRCILLGLGKKDKLDIETLRRAYSKAIKLCHSKKLLKLNIALPEGLKLSDEELARGISEGLLLTNYDFDEYKKEAPYDETTCLVEKVYYIGANKQFIAAAKRARYLTEGVDFARDLVNRNADIVNPHYLGEIALQLSKELPNVTARVFDKQRIEEEGMGLLLAVNRGAANEPTFIILEYQGNPSSQDKTVIVGKGVTFDSGGLNLKPTGYLETMRSDMAGAAAALGTIVSAAKMGLSANITTVVAAAENCIDGNSYKCGDVYSSYAGKTVEIDNTDAEGRLTLADALSYSCKKLSPSRIVDIATLTGAIEIALGSEAGGFMSTNDKLAQIFENAGKTTFERVWRLPLFEEYAELFKSEIADLKNAGGRAAGSITAGLFLEAFIDKKIPWVHVDIAGTAFLKKELRYHPKYATGWGVRLMTEVIENLANK